MNFRLRELRKDKGLRQIDLAQILGISPQSLGYYENQVNKPDPEMLVRMANYFNVSIDYLLGREDDFGNITVTSSPSSDLSASSPNASLTPEEKELLTLFRSLPNIRRKTVIDSIRFMSESPETEENPRKEKRYGSK